MFPQLLHFKKWKKRDFLYGYIFEGGGSRPLRSGFLLEPAEIFRQPVTVPVFFPLGQKPASAEPAFKQAILRYPLVKSVHPCTLLTYEFFAKQKTRFCLELATSMLLLN